MGQRAAATFPLPEVTRSALAPGARGRGFSLRPFWHGGCDSKGVPRVRRALLDQ